MEIDGLVHEKFDASVRAFTLSFKDPELESAYQTAKERFEFLSASSKRFLYVVMIGFLLIELDDAISASGINPAYSFTLCDWLTDLWFVPAFAFEAFFRVFKPLSKIRGSAVAAIGCVGLFLCSFMDNAGNGNYPDFGNEYFLFAIMQ